MKNELIDTCNWTYNIRKRRFFGRMLKQATGSNAFTDDRHMCLSVHQHQAFERLTRVTCMLEQAGLCSNDQMGKILDTGCR